tara:strand:+ start:299 stop:529 length:231 start_codon:yes stop_codon:yes gene_type:complete
MKVQDIYKLAKGKYVTGHFTKKCGEIRKFWGRIEYDDRHPTTLTFWDMRKKEYRRISLKQGEFKIKIGKWELRHVA